ncbi:MAG TPA: hypothetical protein VKT25_06885 [Ktedonobacteraceae bacterium]|nr:hypothetical protein [Ktedonobacteraceae bacterium]
MISPGLASFFAASAGAGAALIGLIFVAVSIAPERTVMNGAPLERQAVASSAFSALINAFFISLFALIPGESLGWVTLTMCILGLWTTIFLGWSLLKHPTGWRNAVRRIALILVGLVVYGFELYVAVVLIKTPSDPYADFTLATLVGVAYGLGLTRAWQLLGARRFSLANWLNPLQDIDAQQSEEGKGVPRPAGKSTRE